MGAGASAGPDPVHNPITRVAAGVVTGGMSEVYYTGRDVTIAAGRAARGDGAGAMAGLIAGEVADGLLDCATGHEYGGEIVTGAAEAVRPAARRSEQSQRR